MKAEDRLDAALAGAAGMDRALELGGLLEMAGEVEEVLAGQRIDRASRDRLYARALVMAADQRWASRLRALGFDRRLQVAGGGVVTIAATAALGLALARGRRHGAAPSSAITA